MYKFGMGQGGFETNSCVVQSLLLSLQNPYI